MFSLLLKDLISDFYTYLPIEIIFNALHHLTFRHTYIHRKEDRWVCKYEVREVRWLNKVKVKDKGKGNGEGEGKVEGEVS